MIQINQGFIIQSTPNDTVNVHASASTGVPTCTSIVDVDYLCKRFLYS